MNNFTFCKKYGVTLIEMMMAVAIFVIVVTGVYGALSAGRSTWADSETSVQLQQNLRLVLEKITRELQESGFDKNGTWQVSINAGGVNGSSILKFSIPVICHNGDSVIDANGDVAYWGAPLTWGCTSYSCMDADNTCATVDYKYLQYAIDSSNQLLRKVLNNASNLVQQTIIAGNITGFTVANSADQKVVTLVITAQKTSGTGRSISASATMNVYLRN